MPDEGISMADAAKAMTDSLVAANADGVTATPSIEQPLPDVAETIPPTVETSTEVTPEATPTFSLDGVDLTGLSEADQKVIRDGFLRQQDYTKKTQDVAPLRKLMEEVGDFDAIRNSVDFVKRLESDPDFLAQVALELQEYVPQEQRNAPPVQPNDATEIPQGADPELVRNINELNEWKAQQEQQRINESLVAEWEEKIQTAENAIRASNPTYDQEDIDELYNLLPAHDYDMFAAQEHYEALNNRAVNRMIQPKLRVPTEANPVNTGSLANSPKEFTNFEDAAAATRERMRQTG